MKLAMGAGNGGGAPRCGWLAGRPLASSARECTPDCPDRAAGAGPFASGSAAGAAFELRAPGAACCALSALRAFP
jgi:hypothetical protein